MKSPQEIENALEQLGNAWPGNASIVEEVMRKIESAPVYQSAPKQWRIVMKSLAGLAASLAVAALLWWGLASDRNSLYAQVIDAVHNARTVHTIQYAQPKEEAKPVKVTETWFDRGVGFREEGLGYIRLGNEQYLWNYSTERRTAVRSETNGIAKATAPIFAEIEQTAQWLRGEFERCPASDLTIDGQSCKAYLLTKLDRYAGTRELTSGKMRLMLFLDPQVRPVRAEYQWREDGRYITKGFVSMEYDQPIDSALFRPEFGNDVKIIDADRLFDDFVSLTSAVHVEERSGLIYAIHRVERFEYGGILVVSSVRGTEETLKKYPLSKRRVRPGEFFVDGPAQLPQSDRSGLLHLASASHQGIDVCWWAVLPGVMQRPTFFEVAPGRLRLPVEVEPHGEFFKLFLDKNGVGHSLYWDIEVKVPKADRARSVEEIANRVFADQIALESIPFKSLDIGRWGAETAVFGDISKTTAAEYAKAIAEKVRSRLESDIDGQIDGQFDPKSQSEVLRRMGVRFTIALSYLPLVNDATLERVAKRPSVAELYLRGTQITDDGLKCLSRLTNLDKLDLAETGITDAGLRHLMGLSCLKHLDLAETKVTAEGVAMLKQALPKIEIKWKAKGSG